ncbi:class III lanthionine synthetase LanKC [Deinococcus sp. 14RED07]|uniref:class III lanthionine synthetase LanKC n=1 Tax=Deinococcus sp. 14RED07 TaxID=2745874 RepID=UPI001E43E313|nr:class III lanthionine synthetase LanKC [Deinococcus sp. 14RED07]MCD0174686.1 class III lanthionine synthetase LanKC [Deinococcus sp. 14RED07]
MTKPRFSAQDILTETLVSPDFYEPLSSYKPKTEYLDVVRSALPVPWRMTPGAFWTQCVPLRPTLPIQGWKIHISGDIQTAAETLRLAVPTLVAHEVTFKFASDGFVLGLMNSKSWARGSSGKLMTIYPRDEQEFVTLLESLHQALRGQSGPYILSDRRYKDSRVVYYRYGGIRAMTRTFVDGQQQSLILTPDHREVEDCRAPYFSPPSWVTDPVPAEPEVPGSGLLGERYRVKRALNFTNSGGVYLAEDIQTGKTVVLKEARPHTSVDHQGNDAPSLLRKEFRLLTLLQSTGVTPVPYGFFQEWEHMYLAQEFIGGNALRSFAAANVDASRSPRDSATYREWREQVRQLAIGVIQAVQCVHDHGVIIGDISLGNMILNEAGHVQLIDFEGAYQADYDPPIMLTTPGFMAPDRFRREVPLITDDLYAVGAALMSLVSLVPMLTPIKPDTIEVFSQSIDEEIGLPRGLRDAVLGLTAQAPGDRISLTTALQLVSQQDDWSVVIRSSPEPFMPARYLEAARRIASYTMSVAQFDRDDKLFPSGPRTLNPLSVDHGALGVARMLNHVTGEVPARVMDWIERRPVSMNDYFPGLYNGLSGVAWSLLDLGCERRAEQALHLAGRHPLLYQSVALVDGAAGYGLTCLRFYQSGQQEKYLDEALRVAQSLPALGVDAAAGLFWPEDASGYARLGYGHGASGVALFYLYLYQVTGDLTHLQLGTRALRYDLGLGITKANGTLGFPEDNSGTQINSPYWQHGSAGVASVALRFWQVTGDTSYLDVVRRVVPDIATKHTLFPTLFKGLSGVGNFLLDCHDALGDAAYLRMAQQAAEGTLLFGIEKPDGLAFPGEYLRRISTDFGSGSAGLALFFHRLATGGANFNFLLDETLQSSALRRIA